ncbi:uncharacterized protein LOC130998418 [Salvia miltiorrhiza]|uniref:uncharacterized protein LOC130998418 n=1 Tax=Salvia miltiorrhiza TaxID=226208 RepID=UPI0025ABC9C5|nr:uncharacterized protein LOC130998418 [Salvia miltiorrhiza]
MSSTTQGSNEFVRCGRKNKTDKTRRSWSTREEEVLLGALKDLVVNGWKSDNGFRAGYLNKLEEAMRKAFPTTDLKGMPHINSKTTVWKKDYYSLQEMLKNTGVGFNATHMIDCNNEQWEAIVQKDNNACLMRNKSWPYYDDWKEIFGKDRANGETAEDMMNAAHDMYCNIDLSQTHGNGEYHVRMDHIFENMDDEESASQTKQPEVVSCVINKKRKRDDGFSAVCEALVQIGRGTEKWLETIASQSGHDHDVSIARKEVFTQLSAIPGLSKKEKFEVCDLLAKEVERLDIFTSLLDDEKPDYVTHLLQEKYNK